MTRDESKLYDEAMAGAVEFVDAARNRALTLEGREHAATAALQLTQLAKTLKAERR